MSYVIVLKEKQGTRYFAAGTKEETDRSSLSILKGRLQSGWYDEEDPDYPDIVAAVKDKTGVYAFHLLLRRSRHEYEDFRIEPVETEYLLP